MSQITDIQQALVQLGIATTSQQGGVSSASSNTSSEVSGNAAVGKDLPVAGQKQAQTTAPASIDQAVVKVNDYLQAHRRTLEFSVDKSTQQTVIKIVDQTSGKILRQIPPEYMIKLAQTLLENNGMSSTGIEVKT